MGLSLGINGRRLIGGYSRDAFGCGKSWNHHQMLLYYLKMIIVHLTRMDKYSKVVNVGVHGVSRVFAVFFSHTKIRIELVSGFHAKFFLFSSRNQFARTSQSDGSEFITEQLDNDISDKAYPVYRGTTSRTILNDCSSCWSSRCTIKR